MAFTSLAMTLADYRIAAIAEIGYGGTAYASLDAGESAEIDRLIRRAEATFWLHPPGVDPPHVWSCLRDPGLLDLWGDVAIKAAVTVSGGAFAAGVTTITATAASFYETMIGKQMVITTIGTFTIASYTSATVVVVTGNASAAAAKTFSIASNGNFPMPADFESPESSTITFTGNAWTPDIELIEERIVTGFRAAQTQTGYPQYAAIRWSLSDGTAIQAQELIVWPEPDTHYEVSIPYMVQPQAMNASTDYPRGGPEMADALLSVVLAVCEEAKGGRRGDRWAEAAEKCAAAARRDRTRHHNFKLGMMRPDSTASPRVFDPKRLILSA